ncbi:MAG: EF-hand domain-containing protein [Methylophilaceae bacterium]
MNVTTKKVVLIAATLLSTAVFSASASADVMLGTGGYNREMHKMEMMKMLDADGNHMVTSAEFDAYYGSLFDELDTDKDGSIDAKEWVGDKASNKLDIATGGYSRQLRTMKMMGMMDADGDHKVTKDEFIGHHKKIFEVMDKDGSGDLNPQEWLARATGKK